MKINLNRHDKGYKIFHGDSVSAGLATGSLVLANGLTYAVRHFQQIGKNENNWGHLAIGLLELVPVIGLVVAIFEKIIFNNNQIQQTVQHHQKELRNVGDNRKRTIKTRIHPSSVGEDVHYERVYRHTVNSKDWYIKETGSKQEYLLFPFYSLFAPGSPQVRLTPEGKVAYKGVKNPRTPISKEMSTYKGLGHALFLITIMGYSDRQVGNALIDDQNRFVLIDYEFGSPETTNFMHNLYRTNKLAAFPEGGHISAEDFYSVQNDSIHSEIDKSLIDFLIFPFDLLQVDNLDSESRERFGWIINEMKKIQNAAIFNFDSVGERHLTRLKQQVDALVNSEEPLANRFSHSLMMRNIDQESFEMTARGRLNQIANDNFLWGRF